MHTYTHYLVTRFNYPKGFAGLEARLKMLTQYALPSVAAQTRRDFTWIIIGRDIDIPEGGNLNIIKTDWPGYQEIIEASKSDYVITTRMDSDDVLHPEFIDSIRKQVLSAGPGEYIIDFDGYRYNTQTGEFVEFNFYNKTNISPFATLVSQTKIAGRGVYTYKHMDLGNHYYVHRIPSRLWCQMVHGNNMTIQWNLKQHIKPTAEKPWFK
jgi:hypothetical protein